MQRTEVSRSAKLMPVPNAPPTPSLRILVVGAGVSGISIARGLLRDGHDVTVFERRPDVKAGGGAVTIWSNGATVLGQLGVDMDGAGQLLSTLRVMTSTGRPVATVDLTAITHRLGAPVRMVPRRVLLERLLEGFPADRISCNARAVGVVTTQNGVRLEFEDGSFAEGDLLIGADGLHSMVRDIVGAQSAEPTGWCSWQGLVTLPNITEKRVAQMIVGEHGSVGLWPAGDSDVQWWFDLPWSDDFIRPERPIDVIRSHFTGWSELCRSSTRDIDRRGSGSVRRSRIFGTRSPALGAQGAVTLLGDAAHTMPPTLAQGTNQALLDTMVLCKALSDFVKGGNGVRSSNRDLSSALRWYENTRRRKVKAVLPGDHAAGCPAVESALRPAALITDRFMTWALTTFLRSVSHRRISAEVSRDLGAATTTPMLTAMNGSPRTTDLCRCPNDVGNHQGATRQAGPRCRAGSAPPVSAPSTADTRAGGDDGDDHCYLDIAGDHCGGPTRCRRCPGRWPVADRGAGGPGWRGRRRAAPAAAGLDQQGHLRPSSRRTLRTEFPCCHAAFGCTDLDDLARHSSTGRRNSANAGP